MAFVRTVRGDIAPEELGVTYAHEHLLTGPPASVADPDFMMDSEEAAARELGFFHAAGGRALVEMTTPDYGRDPAGLRRLSERTGVAVVCVTGWQKHKFCAAHVAGRSVGELADEMVREIEEGIGGTGVRAGVIKAGSSLNAITPEEEKVFRAAARAQRETGALISTHTEAGTMGIEQVELLRSEGADPERILVGHQDRLMDYAKHLAIVRAGAAVGYDQVGKEKYGADTRRAEFVLRLAADGFGDRVALSGDMARRSSWPAYGGWGGPGLTGILWRFVPWLREQGMGEQAIWQLLVGTPARLLAMAR